MRRIAHAPLPEHESHADPGFRLQGLRHPRRGRSDHRRGIRRAPGPRLRIGSDRRGAEGGGRRARRPRLGAGPCGGADPGAGVDRARRRRPRHGDDADALLRRRDARPTWLHERHPGHRQPQPQGLQRLQDGALRPRDPRRGDPAAAPAHRARGLHERQGARRGDGHRPRVRAPHHLGLPAGAADADRRRLRQRRHRRERPGNPACARLRGDRPVLEGRRRFPEPPSRPEQARKPEGPRARRQGDGRRTRPGLRWRRRPPGRTDPGWARDLAGPADHALRTRHPHAPPRGDDHLRRQVQPAPAGGDPRGRRRAADVEDRALAREGQAARDRCAAGRRDERASLLRRALVRLRRRDLHRSAAARDPLARDRPERGARRAADELQHARAERGLCRGRASRAGGRTARARGGWAAEFPGRRGRHHRRAARRLRRRLRPDPRKQHDAVLVLRFEGHTPAALERIEARMLAALRSVKPDAQVAAASH